MDVRVGLWRKLSTEELMLLSCGVGEDSWESLGLQGDPTSPFWRRSALNIHWKDWCWIWSSNTLTTWCKELTPWKRPWCWERLKAGGEGDDRGWDGWMASPTQWTWVWASSRSWWWTGKPCMLQSMASHRVRLSDWIELIYNVVFVSGIQQNDSVIHIFILFQVLFSYRLSQNIEQTSLCYIVDPCWLSILYIEICIC